MTAVEKPTHALPVVPPLCSTRRTPEGTPVVSVEGEIDAASATELTTAVAAAVDGAAAGFCVLDLSAVTFLNAAGLAALVSVAGHGERHGLPVRVVVDSNRRVIRPIEVTGLDRSLALFHTVEEALRAHG
ncbi:STAS domain-containing protein [Actinosynnema sp. NPDC020468]|uniref:STAS domain-containing protein n=1 Tax=Actinosynnema sp. NPDC020468 TaxID=3154488 RepID=UPI00340C2A07